MLYTSPVPPSSGNAYEPHVIAAAVPDGSPLRGSGGSGGSIPGIVPGTVLQTLQNLVNILGTSSLNFAVIGTVIPLGVLADRSLAARREAQAPGRALGATAP